MAKGHKLKLVYVVTCTRGMRRSGVLVLDKTLVYPTLEIAIKRAKSGSFFHERTSSKRTNMRVYLAAQLSRKYKNGWCSIQFIKCLGLYGPSKTEWMEYFLDKCA